MITYFGINILEKSDGLELTRDNYIKVNNKSTLRKGVLYSDSFVNKQTKESLFNYDLNMEYFRLLSKRKFNKKLKKYIKKTKVFKEIIDLAPLNGVSGYYIMVLDKYSQAYIGQSKNIKARIQSHWSKQKEFDRLVFGTKHNSILSIDSFRAYDTTRIFVFPTEELDTYENKFINLFDKKYLLNRTSGGRLAGLKEAELNAKTRALD